MATRRQKRRRRTLFAIALALGVHLAAVLLMSEAGWFEPLLRTHALMTPSSTGQGSDSDKDQPLEIQALVDELQRPEEKTAEEKRREEEKKKEEEDKMPHGQVVDVAKPAIEVRPDEAKYVSEYDTKVERETKKYGRDKAGATDGATPPPPSPPAGQPAEPAQKQAKGGKPGPLAMRDLPRHQDRGANNSLPTAQDGEHPRSGPERAAQPLSRRQAVTGEAGDGQKRKSGAEGKPGAPGEQRPKIAVTPEMLQRAIGKGAGSMDYLKDIDDGDATALNSKKWKHASFFNRVKRAVAEEWHPEMVYVRHDPNGNVYGVKDRVTVLRVRLMPDGKLAGWTVLQSSAVDFLDDEAVEAFKKAAPFPNPPKELIEGDGQIHFNFAFIFELSGHGSLKVYKYQ